MKIKLLSVFSALAIMGCVFIFTSGTSSAQSTNNPPKQNSNQQNNAQQNQAAYKYKAQPGDSYSVLARKAIQTYGIETKTNLSGAQIVFAETNLTQQAKAGLLEVNQEVSISKDTVKSWVDKAKALSAADQAAWNYYIQFVDFNTNKNGQV